MSVVDKFEILSNTHTMKHKHAIEMQKLCIQVFVNLRKNLFVMLERCNTPAHINCCYLIQQYLHATDMFLLFLLLYALSL